MLVLQPAPRPLSRRKRVRVGIAIAGGGPIGGMYELGTLRALDEALEGIDLTRLDVYVGVSSGAFLAAGLANGISTEEMCRIFITGAPNAVRFHPESFLRPAVGEYARRVAAIPRVLYGWLHDLATRPFETNWSDVIGRFGALMPTGLFNNAAIEQFLRDVFETHGRSNDFRKLPRKLYVVAVDLDSGETRRFGAPGSDHVPISRAVQASAALPGLYPPVGIDGRWYVDGALRRTLHASVALDEGAEIVLGLNPLVPFDAGLALAHGRRVPESLVDAGLPMVLSQTFRTMLKSRMQVGLEKYLVQYENSDLVLFEPNTDDPEMFFTNVFSYTSRRWLTEHAYRITLDDLRARRSELAPILARHGIRLRDEILDDPNRTLMTGLGGGRSYNRPAARLRRALDDLAEAIDQRAHNGGPKARSARRPGAAATRRKPRKSPR
jgi:predicted acylesterase/phospholipase RssA